MARLQSRLSWSCQSVLHALAAQLVMPVCIACTLQRQTPNTACAAHHACSCQQAGALAWTQPAMQGAAVSSRALACMVRDLPDSQKRCRYRAACLSAVLQLRRPNSSASGSCTLACRYMLWTPAANWALVSNPAA